VNGSEKGYQSMMLEIGNRTNVSNCLQARLLLISPTPSPASFPTTPLQSNKEAVDTGGTRVKQSRHTASGHCSGTQRASKASAEGPHAAFFLSECKAELRETTQPTPTPQRKLIHNPVEKKCLHPHS